jgi:hypothetical protein
MRFIVVGLVLSCSACHDPFLEPPEPETRLWESGPWQLIYAPDGRPIRRLLDADGNGVAERVETFHPNHRYWRVQTDADGDGFVDKWEVFAPDGELERLGVATKRPGHPDAWIVPDGRGGVRRRELDVSGNGVVDKIEWFDGEVLTRVAVDGNQDGHMDRWQVWQGGRVVSERLDTDGDGEPDRKLVYGENGSIRLESYPY